MFCKCVKLFKIYKTNGFDKIYEILSPLKNKKVKINNISIEKLKHMLECPNFEQEYRSRSATGMYKNEHDRIRLSNWLA